MYVCVCLCVSLSPSLLLCVSECCVFVCIGDGDGVVESARRGWVATERGISGELQPALQIDARRVRGMDTHRCRRAECLFLAGVLVGGRMRREGGRKA